MKKLAAYKDSQILILGLARSGRKVAKIFHELGAHVTVNEQKTREECEGIEELEAMGINLVCGEHPLSLVHANLSLIVKNPGISYAHPLIEKAISLGIEIVTEVEVAFQLGHSKIIGITGSNGKTTTTTWIGKVLEFLQVPYRLAGNIGIPVCEAIDGATEDEWIVTELSSFQLKGTVNYRPKISCLLNISSTHLDYHGNMKDYIQSKAKLFSNQTLEDVAVVNWDDEDCRSLIPKIKARVIPFSMFEKLPYGVFLDRATKQVVYRDLAGQLHSVLSIQEFRILGEFNIQNALAVTGLGIALGIDLGQLRTPLREFQGVEHRLEYVKRVKGVSYYNDSKATNELATIKAIQALQPPIILIGGGLDRGSNYESLSPIFHQKVMGVICMGQTRHKLAKIANLAEVSEVHIIDTISPREALEEAVQLAKKLAISGQIVLLSPACASWDMFKSYEQRGEIFKEIVSEL